MLMGRYCTLLVSYMQWWGTLLAAESERNNLRTEVVTSCVGGWVGLDTFSQIFCLLACLLACLLTYVPWLAR
jgi:hypothetical protein